MQKAKYRINLHGQQERKNETPFQFPQWFPAGHVHSRRQKNQIKDGDTIQEWMSVIKISDTNLKSTVRRP